MAVKLLNEIDYNDVVFIEAEVVGKYAYDGIKFKQLFWCSKTAYEQETPISPDYGNSVFGLRLAAWALSRLIPGSPTRKALMRAPLYVSKWTRSHDTCARTGYEEVTEASWIIGDRRRPAGTKPPKAVLTVTGNKVRPSLNRSYFEDDGPEAASIHDADVLDVGAKRWFINNMMKR